MSENNNLYKDKHRKLMLEEPVAKAILILALPMILSMLIDSIYNITDTYFVSQIGISATAAVGINDSLMSILRSIAMGFGFGASSYASRLLGAQGYEKASRVGSTALITSMIIISCISVIALLFISPLVIFLGATQTVKPYSIQYASWILLSSPFTVGSTVLSQLLRSEGNTKLSMYGTVAGCIINIALDPLFINYLKLGISGAAMATGISKGISFLLLLLPYLYNKTVIKLEFKLFTPKKYVFAEIAKMGIPIFLRSSLFALAAVVMNTFAGSFGDTALAAVSVANKCTKVVGAAIIGLGLGFQPLAGYCWGAGAYTRIRKAFWACSWMGAAGAVVLGLLLALFAPRLIEVFSSVNDAKMVDIGSYIIISQSITLIMHVFGMVANGLFQALGRPVGAAFLGLSRQLIFLIPCIIILSHLFGVYGLAVAQAASDVLTATMAVLMTCWLMRKIKALEV